MRRPAARVGLYVGGFLGPFVIVIAGGAIVHPILFVLGIVALAVFLFAGAVARRYDGAEGEGVTPRHRRSRALRGRTAATRRAHP